MQLFDVRQPTEPKLLFKEKLGNRDSSSEALTDPLAFSYLADRNLSAIPITLCQGKGGGQSAPKSQFLPKLGRDVAEIRLF